MNFWKRTLFITAASFALFWCANNSKSRAHELQLCINKKFDSIYSWSLWVKLEEVRSSWWDNFDIENRIQNSSKDFICLWDIFLYIQHSSSYIHNMTQLERTLFIKAMEDLSGINSYDIEKIWVSIASDWLFIVSKDRWYKKIIDISNNANSRQIEYNSIISSTLDKYNSLDTLKHNSQKLIESNVKLKIYILDYLYKKALQFKKDWYTWKWVELMNFCEVIESSSFRFLDVPK